MSKPTLMVIGLDSVSLTLLDRFAGACPAIRRLMRRGATGRALPCFPVYTPTNWACLSTGADPSTTAAPGWHNNVAGETLSTFDRRAIPCETIFQAVARAGLSSLAIAYPTAYPPAGRANGVLMPLDRGLVSNGLVPGKIVATAFDAAGVFPLVLVEAPGWAGGGARAKAVGATEDGASLAGSGRRAVSGQVKAWVFRTGRNAWKLGFTPEAARATVAVPHGRWSDPIRVDVAVPGRPGRCVVRVMMFDAGRRMAVSEAYDIGHLGCPAGLARAVFERLGPPTEHSLFYHALTRQFRDGRQDPALRRLLRQDLRAQASWIVQAAALVQKLRPYDVFYLHYHHPDSVLHTYLSAAEGAREYGPTHRRLALRAIPESLRIADELVAGLLKLAGPRTTVLLVSDHGNVPNRYGCNLGLRLKETGLTVFRANGSVDKRRCLAWPSRHLAASVGTWVDVNARQGTPRYEQLQRKVIDALLDWRTEDGERVVAVALRRKDSHLLGYYGRCCADVTFHYNSGFAWAGGNTAVRANGWGANHGPQMPATFSRLSDNLAFYVLAGPGVKAGWRRDERRCGYVRLEDLLPTTCRAANLPAPRHATGAVRHELLR